MYTAKEHLTLMAMLQEQPDVYVLFVPRMQDGVLGWAFHGTCLMGTATAQRVAAQRFAKGEEARVFDFQDKFLPSACLVCGKTIRGKHLPTQG